MYKMQTLVHIMIGLISNNELNQKIAIKKLNLILCFRL